MKRRFTDKDFMPIAIEVYNKPIVLIGGGRIALQKVEALLRYTNKLTIIAPEILDEILAYKLPCKFKKYETSDIKGAFIVYACTNISDLNARVYADCHKHGILVNVVDNPATCDFVMPAIYKKEHMSVAVTSNAVSAIESVNLRNKIKEFLENDNTQTV